MPEHEPLILTPTARLARTLAREVAAVRVARGERAWVSPRILSFPAWLASVRGDYFLSTDDPRVPIDPQQALHLWQSLIDRDVFVGEPRVAELALRAWRLIHEYQLPPPERWPALYLSEDSGRFQDWAARYQTLCARQNLVDDWSFYAELPQLLRDRRMAVTGTVELAGFDLPLTPLQQSIVDAIASGGAEVRTRSDAGQQHARHSAPDQVAAFADPDDELAAAARWARARLEADPGARLAVVVADLSARLGLVDGAFRRVFDPPGFALEQPGPEPWHVSLGLPLARWPLVSDALAVLALDERGIDQPAAGRVLRSPFLSGYEPAGGPRDRALARLTRDAAYRVTVYELQRLLEREGANDLAAALGAWQQYRRQHAGPAWPSEWAARFQQELNQLGFGRGRSLDSREFQVLRRWHELLESFGALDVVCDGPMAHPTALRQLTERAGNAVFRESDPGAPVEVLGVEEALGSRFDALWITTLDSDSWPGAVRRDPLIPAALQRDVPRATSDGCLARARLELDGLLAAAPEVRTSFSRGSDEDAREASALLQECTVIEASAPELPETAPQTYVADDVQAPPLIDSGARGGVGVLRQQSECPFRAFAERRLGARELKPPRPGLNPGQRGTLIHQALEQFWTGLPDQAALNALSVAALEERIGAAVAAALTQLTERYRLLLTDTGRRLEQRRSERVLQRWIHLEQRRASFAVVDHERDVDIVLGGLILRGKIDRIDRLADGRTLLIDYKTGQTAKASWKPEPRMGDPQLPAYAVALDEPPSAIAFARIRPEALAFDGLADGDVGTNGITDLAAARHAFKDIDDWSELMTSWREHIEALAGDFRAGRAAVDPRRGACTYCHLHALCRIEERAPFVAYADDPEPGTGPAAAPEGDDV
ncbi:MAG: PD-(D/E)XK nuclease family protein [Pseudomonadales bacterium]